MEIWKDIPNYEGFYRVSNLGRVKSIPRKVPCRGGKERLLKEKILSHLNINGYTGVHLRKTKEKSQVFLLHRALALCFIPNPNNYSDVNHKNGIKNDNRLENLEWVTKSQNSQHAWNNNLMKITDKMLKNFKDMISKKVIDTSDRTEYTSAKEVAQKFNINHQYLINKLNGNKRNNTTFIYKPEL